MHVTSLDHLVLTVADVERTAEFYRRALGMEYVSSQPGRHALVFGSQKINLHAHGREIDPHAEHPTPGSGDLCFLTDVPLPEVMAHLRGAEVGIIEGPLERAGARGPILSVYFRDPDGNLIEVSSPVG